MERTWRSTRGHRHQGSPPHRPDRGRAVTDLTAHGHRRADRRTPSRSVGPPGGLHPAAGSQCPRADRLRPASGTPDPRTSDAAHRRRRRADSRSGFIGRRRRQPLAHRRHLCGPTAHVLHPAGHGVARGRWRHAVGQHGGGLRRPARRLPPVGRPVCGPCIPMDTTTAGPMWWRCGPRSATSAWPTWPRLSPKCSRPSTRSCGCTPRPESGRCCWVDSLIGWSVTARPNRSTSSASSSPTSPDPRTSCAGPGRWATWPFGTTGRPSTTPFTTTATRTGACNGSPRPARPLRDWTDDPAWRCKATPPSTTRPSLSGHLPAHAHSRGRPARRTS